MVFPVIKITHERPVLLPFVALIILLAYCSQGENDGVSYLGQFTLGLIHGERYASQIPLASLGLPSHLINWER